MLIGVAESTTELRSLAQITHNYEVQGPNSGSKTNLVEKSA